jgi:hypothetical protein
MLQIALYEKLVVQAAPHGKGVEPNETGEPHPWSSLLFSFIWKSDVAIQVRPCHVHSSSGRKWCCEVGVCMRIFLGIVGWV